MAQMPDQQVPVAIIGLGHIGKFHIRAIQQFKELNLVAVCDRQKDFEGLAPEGVDFYADFQELLADERIDTVIIATPNHTHYYIAMNAITAGKHVILEKPAAEGMNELHHLERTAGEKEVTIYYAFHAASAFDVAWTRNYLDDPDIDSELGHLTGFTGRFYDPYIVNGSLLTEANGLQNCWLDSGINALSVIHRFVKPESLVIENVSAAASSESPPGILQCIAEYRFQIKGPDLSGTGSIDTNWTAERNHKSTTLYFGESRNVIMMDHSAQKVIRWYPDGTVKELADLSQGENRLYNHYLGVFTDYLRYKKKGNSLSRMNSDESIAAHELLFRTEAAINRPLGYPQLKP